MKKMIVILSMLAATSAFATTVTEHGYREALGGIALDNACLTNDEVRSIKPVTFCAQYEERTVNSGEGYIYTDYVCKAWETRSVSYSRSFERTVCTQYRNVPAGDGALLECTAWSKVSDVLPDSINVRVSTHGEGSNWPGEVRKFSFPRCN